jgi:hypothetical protein
MRTQLPRQISNTGALHVWPWAVLFRIAIDKLDSNTLAEMLSISERFQDLPFDFDFYRDRADKLSVNVLR